MNEAQAIIRKREIKNEIAQILKYVSGHNSEITRLKSRMNKVKQLRDDVKNITTAHTEPMNKYLKNAETALAQGIKIGKSQPGICSKLGNFKEKTGDSNMHLAYNAFDSEYYRCKKLIEEKQSNANRSNKRKENLEIELRTILRSFPTI